MRRVVKIVLCAGLLMFSCACAYRYYLGMHGPSVRAFPDFHGNVSADQDCLGCHSPGDASGAPATSHPQFTGCLKCHND